MSKTSILTIAIQLVKQGNGDQATVKALAQLRQGWTQAMGVMAAAAGAGMALNGVYQNTVKVLVDYAAQVRSLSRLTGMNAEETSRLIQLSDDLTISYETLTKALWTASKNGVDVSIESLASLADTYTSLESPMERSAFLAETFGKSGMEMGKLLEQGASGVRAYADAVGSSLVINEAQVQAAREVEIQLDSLQDAWQGLKLVIGSGLTGAVQIDIDPNSMSLMETLTASLEGWTGLFEDIERQNAIAVLARQMAELNGDASQAPLYFDQATRSLEQYWQEMATASSASDDLSQSLEDQQAAADAVNRHYETMLDVTQRIQAASEDYTQVVDEQMAVNADLVAQYQAGTITLEEYNSKIADSEQKIQDAAAAHEESANRIVFSLIQMQMAADGLSAAEGQALLQIGVDMGLFEQSSVDMAMGYIAKSQEMINAAAATGTGIDTGLQPGSQAMQDAYQDAHALKEQLDGLEKKSGSVWMYTIIINTIGSIPNLPSSPSSGGTYVSHDGYQERASGGQLGAGYTLVGEQGYELITPSGYVIPHEVARAMLASGMAPEFQFRTGGDMSPDERDYYANRPRGDVDEVRAARRRERISAPRARRSRGDEYGAPLYDPVAPLAAETQAATVAMETASQAQARMMSAQTSAINNGNSEVVAAVKALGRKIDRIPGATRDAVLLAAV